MTVLHEHSLGWVKGPTGNGVGADKKYYFRGGQKGFPYQTIRPVTVVNAESQGTSAAVATPGGDGVTDAANASVLKQISRG